MPLFYGFLLLKCQTLTVVVSDSAMFVPAVNRTWKNSCSVLLSISTPLSENTNLAASTTGAASATSQIFDFDSAEKRYIYIIVISYKP